MKRLLNVAHEFYLKSHARVQDFYKMLRVFFLLTNNETISETHNREM